MSIHQEAPPEVRPRLGMAGTLIRLTLIGAILAAVVMSVVLAWRFGGGWR